MVASNVPAFPKGWQTPSTVLLLPGDAMGATGQTPQETPGGEEFTACEQARGRVDIGMG